MRLLISVMAICALLVAACTQPAPAVTPKPDVAAEEKAIRDRDAEWLKAAQARDAAGEAALFADDGVAYREHQDPFVGPAAVQAYGTKFYANNPKGNATWTTDAIRFGESADLAIQTGEYHYTGLGPKGVGEDKGRFVTVWKKVGGQWKVAYDIGSTTMPEPASEKK
jgi:uncharacterized protein (TIGR02246 family)